MVGSDLLFEHAVCGYISCAVNGVIGRANQTIADWLGYLAGDLRGMRFQHLLSPGARIFYETQFVSILDIEGSIREVAFELKRKDGTHLPVLVSAIRQRGEGHAAATNWITIFNATERRRYEEDLLQARRASDQSALALKNLNETLELRVSTEVAERMKAEEALRQSQKMEAIGQLTGGLAHDFNNLLAGITGNLDLLKLRLGQGRVAEADRYVNAAQGAAKRAANLTHRLLAFARRQTLDAKPTDLSRVIRGIEELVRRTVEPQVELETVDASGLWTAVIDANQLENAVLNLCINARDAMPDGGRLTIETSNKWLDEGAADSIGLIPGQYVTVCVTDTGTGMSPEVVQRAFDPFYTTKPLGAGTGLGLSMVYGFARQSNGHARIYSEVGQGTTVCLYLPRHAGKETIEDHVIVEAHAVATAEKTILVVEDEATVRAMVMEVIRDQGHRVIEASNGASGLTILQSGTRIDLMVTDVGLPGGMNGRQLADAGRALRPGLQILFVTGYAENAVLGNGQLGTGLCVLTKPFTLDALVRKVNDLLV